MVPPSWRQSPLSGSNHMLLLLTLACPTIDRLPCAAHPFFPPRGTSSTFPPYPARPFLSWLMNDPIALQTPLRFPGHLLLEAVPPFPQVLRIWKSQLFHYPLNWAKSAFSPRSLVFVLIKSRSDPLLTQVSLTRSSSKRTALAHILHISPPASSGQCLLVIDVLFYQIGFFFFLMDVCKCALLIHSSVSFHASLFQCAFTDFIIKGPILSNCNPFGV